MSNRMFPSHDASCVEAVLAYQFPWAHGHCWQRARASAAVLSAAAGLVSKQFALRVLDDAKGTLGPDFDLEPLVDDLRRWAADESDGPSVTLRSLSLTTLQLDSRLRDYGASACDRCESKSCPNSHASRWPANASALATD